MKKRIVLSVVLALASSCVVDGDDVLLSEGPDAGLSNPESIQVCPPGSPFCVDYPLPTHPDCPPGTIWWGPTLGCLPPASDPWPKPPAPSVMLDEGPTGGGIGTSPGPEDSLVPPLCFPGAPPPCPRWEPPKTCACQPIPACCTLPVAPEEPEEPGPTDTTGLVGGGS